MASDVVIRAERLGKDYSISHLRAGAAAYGTLRDTIMSALTAPLRRRRAPQDRDSEETFSALTDVSFEIAQGEVIGLIGHNGAGKSTLLKILSRIVEPTRGFAEVRGRVGSLLEVGSGFHPELTGRENVLLNGAILGMSKRDVRARFDEIVAFAEVEQFIDTPVKHYSTGMYLRLAFAVAAHLNPDILLVDEVLAVGDLAFQAKCLNAMQGVSSSGRTVVLVSHNLASIKRLCTRTLLLSKGKLVADGPTAEVVDRYMELGPTELLSNATDCRFADALDVPMQVSRLALLEPSGASATPVRTVHQPMRVRIEYTVRQNIPSAYVMCGIANSEGVDVVWTYDGDTPLFGNREPGRYAAEFDIPAEVFTTGRYFVRAAIVDTNKGTVHFPGVAFGFSVEDTESLLAHRNIPWPGLTRLNPAWSTSRLADQAARGGRTEPALAAPERPR